jgi:hypothetical protein
MILQAAEKDHKVKEGVWKSRGLGILDGAIVSLP